MPLPTVEVTGSVYLPNGTPPNAEVEFRLTDLARTGDYVAIPEFVKAPIDQNGNFSIDLWPTELGPGGYSYEAYIRHPGFRRGPHADFRFHIPDTPGPLQIGNLISSSPPPALTDAEFAVREAQAAATISGQNLSQIAALEESTVNHAVAAADAAASAASDQVEVSSDRQAVDAALFSVTATGNQVSADAAQVSLDRTAAEQARIDLDQARDAAEQSATNADQSAQDAAGALTTLSGMVQNGLEMPVGPTSSRPAHADGLFRYNTDTKSPELSFSGNWYPFSGPFFQSQVGVQLSAQGGAVAFVHGLPAQPVKLTAWLTCVSSDNSYQVGDIVPLGNALNTSESWGYNFRVVGGQIFFFYGRNAALQAPGHPSYTSAIDISKWRFFVRAEL